VGEDDEAGGEEHGAEEDADGEGEDPCEEEIAQGVDLQAE